MKKALLVLAVVFVAMSVAMAQSSYVSPVDVLGAHNNNGRGCAGCHAPHSGSAGSGHATAADSGNYALWGQDASPLYGAPIAFGDGGKYVEVLPATITGGSAEVGGILLCLSCHDGNVTSKNMMANQSYEQKIGLLTNTAYGALPIPTLLGSDGSTAGNYNNDHPVGINANISTGNGLLSTNGVLTVTAGSQYATFVSNYGWPSLAPGKYSSPYGINPTTLKPFVTCTTCHNQHVMSVYTATTASPIAGNATGFYATYFFVNGPYNPNQVITGTGFAKAPSTSQFCRQCHFGESNEANNTSLPTQF